MGSCIQLHLSTIWCVSVNSLTLANLYRSSLLRLERDNENRRICPLNKSEKNQQNAELLNSRQYLLFLRIQMISREDILNWCLTVIDVFVIIILSVAYYCYIQYYGEQNLKDKYLSERQKRNQLNPMKDLFQFILKYFNENRPKENSAKEKRIS